MAFDISQQVNVVNPTANVDYYYGPHADITTACEAVPMSIRAKGKTVGIITTDGVVEYWWKNGITNADLVEKTIQGKDGEKGEKGDKGDTAMVNLSIVGDKLIVTNVELSQTNADERRY